MVDVGLSMVIVRRLNRYYRKRAKPHGKTDHYRRGVRLTPTIAKRVVYACMWLSVLAVVIGFFFIPNFFSGMPLFQVLLLKAGWVLMAGMALIAPLAAVRDFVLVTDDGLIKPKLFGGEQRFDWNDIVSVQIEANGEDIVIAGNGRNCKISLAYDGWQDLLETASKHLQPPLYERLVALHHIDSGRTRTAGKIRA